MNEQDTIYQYDLSKEISSWMRISETCSCDIHYYMEKLLKLVFSSTCRSQLSAYNSIANSIKSFMGDWLILTEQFSEKEKLENVFIIYESEIIAYLKCIPFLN